MNTKDIIEKALVEYDNATPVIKYLLENTEYEGNKSINDLERTKMVFFDKETDEKILETETEIIAVYYDKLQIWSWAWSQIGLKSAENYLSKEILRYALSLESNLSYIKSILITSRGIIKDTAQIDINLAISSSIIKHPYIYPYKYPIEENNLIYYFVLLNNNDLQKLKEKIENNK